MYFNLRTKYRTIINLTAQIISVEIINQRIQLDLINVIKRDKA